MRHRRILLWSLLFHDPFDPWGWCIGWHFAIADYAYRNFGRCLPGYTPPKWTLPGYRGLEYTELEYAAPEWEELEYAAKVLTRFAAVLDNAGQSY